MPADELTDEQFDRVEAFGIHEDDSPSVTLAFSRAAESIELAVSQVRARLAPVPEEGIHKSGDEMIDDLEWSKYGLGQIALQLKQSSELVRQARGAWARKHAVALRMSDGKSSELREADAVLACEGEQLALDMAEVAQEYAKNTARAIEQTGSMTQTQAAVLRSQLALAGTGREA